jgi:hypothetical protein
MVRSRPKAAHRGKPGQCLWLGPVTATADQRAIVSLRRAYLAELLRKAICDVEKLSARALGLNAYAERFVRSIQGGASIASSCSASVACSAPSTSSWRTTTGSGTTKGSAMS